MKVIFLDFDGVLNSNQYNASHWSPGVLIDPSRMILLKRLVDAANAEIVLSTSWKEHWNQDESLCDETGIIINQIFREHSLKIFDKIPDTERDRAAGIIKWLSKHPDAERFAVIDDMPQERCHLHFTESRTIIELKQIYLEVTECKTVQH